MKKACRILFLFAAFRSLAFHAACRCDLALAGDTAAEGQAENDAGPSSVPDKEQTRPRGVQAKDEDPSRDLERERREWKKKQKFMESLGMSPDRYRALFPYPTPDPSPLPPVTKRRPEATPEPQRPILRQHAGPGRKARHPVSLVLTAHGNLLLGGIGSIGGDYHDYFGPGAGMQIQGRYRHFEMQHTRLHSYLSLGFDTFGGDDTTVKDAVRDSGGTLHDLDVSMENMSILSMMTGLSAEYFWDGRWFAGGSAGLGLAFISDVYADFEEEAVGIDASGQFFRGTNGLAFDVGARLGYAWKENCLIAGSLGWRAYPAPDPGKDFENRLASDFDVAAIGILHFGLEFLYQF